MRLPIKIIPCLFVLLFCFACSDSGDSRKSASPPANQAPPEFSKADDPKVFIEEFLADLRGEKFLPAPLVMELEDGRTQLSDAVSKVAAHHSVAFIEWYYSEAYLAKVWDLVGKKVERMDYQLKVLRVARDDAAEVVFVSHAGPLVLKKKLLEGEVKQQWKKKDEQSYDLILSAGQWQQPLRVVREKGAWKLELANSQGL